MKTEAIIAATLAAASMSAVFQANAETFTTNGVTSQVMWRTPLMTNLSGGFTAEILGCSGRLSRD